MNVQELIKQFTNSNTTRQEKAWLNLAVEQALHVKDENGNRPNSIEITIALNTLKIDEETLIAALMSSPVLEAKWDEKRLKAQFNDKIAALVKSVRWLNNFKGCTDEKNLEAIKPEQAERVRRMILSVVEDVRAVLIKLAYRLKRLRYLAKDSYEVRKCVAQETLDLYTPLANRLGLAQFKWEMEDLAFRCLNPQAYKYIAKSLEDKRAERERYIANFVADLENALSKENIQADCVGRPKHIYSIWRKMQKKQLDVKHLYDVRAVRVLVKTMPECYQVLGIAHQKWQPITQEFDDYISHPKTNGYSSLHTAIIGAENKAVEIQIRTHEMHEHAELGFAAHWKYKEGGEQDVHLEHSINALRNLLEQNNNDQELLESFNQELFQNRVFIFTPDGEVQELPKGSTPLDFAYRIHTSLGHKCQGALVNGKIASLTTVLANGDQVEVLTKKNAKPSRDWMNKSTGYIYSSKIRTKVRNWFNTLDKEKHLEDGQQILEKFFNKNHISLSEIPFFVKKFHVENEQSLYINIAKGTIQTSQLLEAWNREHKIEEIPKSQDIKSKKTTNQIKVIGVDNLMVKFPKCCSPVPYDEILGFITQGQGISIHRKNCKNLQNLDEAEQKRLIEVDWDQNKNEQYQVNIKIISWDRPNLLKDIIVLLSDFSVNVLEVASASDKDKQTATINLKIEVKTLEQLTKILTRIQSKPNIISVDRF